MKYFLFFLAAFSAASAQAQNEPSVSILLEQGYKIVAASSYKQNNAIVFLQKRQSAFMCYTGPPFSRCFDLKNSKSK